MKKTTTAILIAAALLGLVSQAQAQTSADREFMSKLYALHLKSLTLTLKADDDGLKALLPQFEQLTTVKGVSPDCMAAAQARLKMAHANLAFLDADEASPAEASAMKELAESGQIYDAKRLSCLGQQKKP